MSPQCPLGALSVGPISPDPRNSGVDTVTVTLTGEAFAGTFDFNDLILTRDGGPNLIDNTVSVAPQGGGVYEIQGLLPFTSPEGIYTLTVLAESIDDLGGTAGVGSVFDSWEVDLTGAVLESILPVSPDPINTPVDSVFVTFNEKIDISTFDFNDVTLELDGAPVPLGPGVTTSLLIGSTYEIANLTPFTGAEGEYTLTVSGVNVSDLLGNTGSGAVGDIWVQDFTPPQVTAIAPVSPDPRNQPVSFVEVELSEVVVPSSFTNLDVTLTRDGGPNLIDGTVTITHLTGTTYRINNLAPLTALDGAYVLTVNSTTMQDAASNLGINSMQEFWTMDVTAPSVLDIVEVAPDPRDTDVTSIVVEFTESVSGFGLEDLTLTLNGGPNLIDGSVTITPLGGGQYEIGNLDALTGTDGLYVLTVDATGVSDGLNTGTGSAQEGWIKNEFGPVLVSVGPVAPDPRNTAVSTVQVAFSGDLDLATFDFNDITLTFNGGSDLIVDASTTITQIGVGLYELGG